MSERKSYAWGRQGQKKETNKGKYMIHNTLETQWHKGLPMGVVERERERDL